MSWFDGFMNVLCICKGTFRLRIHLDGSCVPLNIQPIRNTVLRSIMRRIDFHICIFCTFELAGYVCGFSVLSSFVCESMRRHVFKRCLIIIIVMSNTFLSGVRSEEYFCFFFTVFYVSAAFVFIVKSRMVEEPSHS